VISKILCFEVNQNLTSIFEFPKVVLLLGRPRRRWEDNIKMDLQEVGGGYGDWMETCEYGNELSGSINAGNFLTSYKTS
jgi:hypothetical protein